MTLIEQMHPVDVVYLRTRAAWQRYWEMSTPWPDDWPNRCRLIEHRMVITETRLRLLAESPPDRRTAIERQSLLAMKHGDQLLLDLHK